MREKKLICNLRMPLSRTRRRFSPSNSLTSTILLQILPSKFWRPTMKTIKMKEKKRKCLNKLTS